MGSIIKSSEIITSSGGISISVINIIILSEPVRVYVVEPSTLSFLPETSNYATV